MIAFLFTDNYPPDHFQREPGPLFWLLFLLTLFAVCFVLANAVLNQTP